MLAAAADAGVRRLALADPVGVSGEWLPGLHDRALARLAARGDAEAHAALAAHPPAALADPDAAAHAAYARAFYPAWFADGDLARLFVPPRAASPTGAAVAARLRREGYDWRATLRALRAPTLVVHGEEDVLDVAVARATVAWLAGSVPTRLEVLGGAGHMPFWEAPTGFFALVQSFLDAPILAHEPAPPDA
jgi:proline iminopeptidase